MQKKHILAAAAALASIFTVSSAYADTIYTFTGNENAGPLNSGNGGVADVITLDTTTGTGTIVGADINVSFTAPGITGFTGDINNIGMINIASESGWKIYQGTKYYATLTPVAINYPAMIETWRGMFDFWSNFTSNPNGTGIALDPNRAATDYYVNPTSSGVNTNSSTSSTTGGSTTTSTTSGTTTGGSTSTTTGGATSTGGATTSTSGGTVPEPGAFGLFALGAGALALAPPAGTPRQLNGTLASRENEGPGR